jgi:membrane protein YqaA with SNARE-associated domain
MSRLVEWVQAVLLPTLGPIGLFLVALVDSSFLSLPEINDFLVISAALADARTVWIFVAMAALGSVVGSSLLWRLGRAGGETLLVRRFGTEWAGRTQRAYTRWGVLALAVPAILPPPMPFKVFVLASGVFGFPYLRFVLTLLLARTARYSFWGTMGVVYGDEAERMLLVIDSWGTEHLPLVFAVAFVLLLVALLVARRRRTRMMADGSSGPGGLL